MPLAKGTRSIERFMRIGKPRSTKRIEDNTKWTHIIDTVRNGVVDMISCLVWFGIGCICGAMMLVSFSVITYDERIKKKAYKEIHKADEELLNSDWGELEINEKQEKEREKDEN